MPNEGEMDNVDLPPKPMRGKYDGRKNNGATRARRRVRSDLGRKPLWLRTLGKNDASKTLDEFDAIASAAELYCAAWEAKKFDLCFEMRRYANDRLLGKPFTAENPAKATSPNNLAKDERLQKAIKQLLPARSPTKTVM